MRKIYRLVDQVAQTKVTVLISGETGVGKEIIANLIHYNSQRSKKPFTTINCGSFTDNGLLQSELFGHEKGAFTSAIHQRIGVFEQANTGTLFLDEVGEMHPEVQVMLLRALDNQKIKRLGGSRAIDVDVRILSATNKCIETEVKKKRFREDLYYRLNGFHIEIPPLRERREDISTLVDTFIAKLSDEHSKTITRITPKARNCLETATLPGNIRQLKNAINRAVIATQNSELGLEDLPANIGMIQQAAPVSDPPDIVSPSSIPPEIQHILGQISVKEFILIFGEIPNVVWQKLPEKTQLSIIREASYHLSKLLGSGQNTIQIDGMNKDQILCKIARQRIEKYGSATKAAASLNIDRRTLKVYTEADSEINT